MKTINELPNLLKEAMLQGMFANFKMDGSLMPVFFFLKENQPCMSLIPPEFLSSHEGKVRLSELLREISKDPRVTAVGLIYEAYMACTESESQLDKLLNSGNLRVADLKAKQDVIVMLFATPDREEAFIFPVDIKNKRIGERFNIPDGATEGIFTNFFTNAA